MRVGRDTAQRFRARVREELDPLPLSAAQKGRLVPLLLAEAEFVDTDGGKRPPGRLRDDSHYFAFAAKIDGAVAGLAPHGLTRDEYLRAAAGRPKLFFSSPESVVGNIEGVVTLLATEGLTARAYVRAALRNSALFTMSPATVAGNMLEVARRFAGDGLTLAGYVRAAARAPILFSTSPERVAGNVTGLVLLFAEDGLTLRAYLRAALRHPSLFAWTPAAAAANVAGTVELLATGGLTVREYLRAAVREPQLFCQAPETIAANVTGVVAEFAAEGLRLADYLRAAVRQPSLFTTSSATVARHVRLLFELYEAGVFTVPRPKEPAGLTTPRTALLDFLLRRPLLMCLDDTNLRLRRIHQLVTGDPTRLKNLTRSRRATELELMRHLGHADPSQPVPDPGYSPALGPPTGRQARLILLRALVRCGYVTSVELDRERDEPV